MMILMTAALAAAAPAVSATPGGNPHAQHMAMGHSGTHEPKKCCECCKDMADKKDGHAERKGEQPTE